MSVHDDIRSALRYMGSALDAVDATSARAQAEAGELHNSLRNLSDVHENNAQKASHRLGELQQQIADDTGFVMGAQAEVSAGFDGLHDQKHRSLDLIKGCFEQTLKAMREQHAEHLRRMEEINSQMLSCTAIVAEGYESEHSLWSRHAENDLAQIEIGGYIGQNLGKVRESSGVQEAIVREMDDHQQREEAVRLNELGARNLATGLYNEALGLLIRAADLCPEEPAIRINLGWAYLLVGRLEDARKEALKAVEQDGDASGAYRLLGHVELGERKAADAIQAFIAADELAPGSEENILGLGLAYAAAGEYHTALGHWQRIASNSSTFIEGLLADSMAFRE